MFIGSDCTIRVLKEHIERITRAPAMEQQLTYSEVVLEDDDESVSRFVSHSELKHFNTQSRSLLSPRRHALRFFFAINFLRHAATPKVMEVRSASSPNLLDKAWVVDLSPIHGRMEQDDVHRHSLLSRFRHHAAWLPGSSLSRVPDREQAQTPAANPERE